MTAPSANQKVVEPSSSEPSRDEHAEATSHLQANKTQSPTSDVRGLSAPAETNNPIARAIENMIIGHAPDQTRESAANIERTADQRNEHTLYSSVWGALAAALIKATPTNTPASTRHRCEELLREITLAEEREKKRKRGDGRDDTFLRALSSILGERAAEDVFSKIEELRKTNDTSPQASAEIARELLTALSPGDTLLTLHTATHTEKREGAGSDVAGVATPEALEGLVKELRELGERAAQVEKNGHPTIAKALRGLAEEKIAEHEAELAALSPEEQRIIRSLFFLSNSAEADRLATANENLTESLAKLGEGEIARLFEDKATPLPEIEKAADHFNEMALSLIEQGGVRDPAASKRYLSEAWDGFVSELRSKRAARESELRTERDKLLTEFLENFDRLAELEALTTTSGGLRAPIELLPAEDQKRAREEIDLLRAHHRDLVSLRGLEHLAVHFPSLTKSKEDPDSLAFLAASRTAQAGAQCALTPTTERGTNPSSHLSITESAEILHQMVSSGGINPDLLLSTITSLSLSPERAEVLQALYRERYESDLLEDLSQKELGDSHSPIALALEGEGAHAIATRIEQLAQAPEDLRANLTMVHLRSLSAADYPAFESHFSEHPGGARARLVSIGGEDLGHVFDAMRAITLEPMGYQHHATLLAAQLHSQIYGQTPHGEVVTHLVQRIGSLSITKPNGATEATPANLVHEQFERLYGSSISAAIDSRSGDPTTYRLSEGARLVSHAILSNDPKQITEAHYLVATGLLGERANIPLLQAILSEASPERRCELRNVALTYAAKQTPSHEADDAREPRDLLRSALTQRATGDVVQEGEFEVVRTMVMDGPLKDEHLRQVLQALESARVGELEASHALARMTADERMQEELTNGARFNLESSQAEASSSWIEVAAINPLFAARAKTLEADRVAFEAHSQELARIRAARQTAELQVHAIRSEAANLLRHAARNESAEFAHAQMRLVERSDALRSAHVVRQFPNMERYRTLLKEAQGLSQDAIGWSDFAERNAHIVVAVGASVVIVVASGGTMAPLVVAGWATAAAAPVVVWQQTRKINRGETNLKGAVASGAWSLGEAFLYSWGAANLVGRFSVSASRGLPKGQQVLRDGFLTDGTAVREGLKMFGRWGTLPEILSAEGIPQNVLLLYAQGSVRQAAAQLATAALMTLTREWLTSQTDPNPERKKGSSGVIGGTLQDQNPPRSEYDTTARPTSDAVSDPRVFGDFGGLFEHDIFGFLNTGSIFTTTQTGAVHAPPPPPPAQPPPPPEVPPEDSSKPPPEAPSPRGPIAVDDVPNSYVLAAEREAKGVSITPSEITSPSPQVAPSVPVGVETFPQQNQISLQTPSLPIQEALTPNYRTTPTSVFSEQPERSTAISYGAPIPSAVPTAPASQQMVFASSLLASGNTLHAPPQIVTIATLQGNELREVPGAPQTHHAPHVLPPIGMKDALNSDAQVATNVQPRSHERSLMASTREVRRVSHLTEQPRILEQRAEVRDIPIEKRKVALETAPTVSPQAIEASNGATIQHGSRHPQESVRPNAHRMAPGAPVSTTATSGVSLTPLSHHHVIPPTLSASPAVHATGPTPIALHHTSPAPHTLRPSLESPPAIRSEERRDPHPLSTPTPATEVTTLERLELASLEISERARRRAALAHEKREALEAKELRSKRRLRSMIMHQLTTMSFNQVQRQRLLHLLVKLGVSEREYRELLTKVGDLHSAQVNDGGAIQREAIAVKTEAPLRPSAVVPSPRLPQMKGPPPSIRETQQKRITRAELYARMKAEVC